MHVTRLRFAEAVKHYEGKGRPLGVSVLTPVQHASCPKPTLARPRGLRLVDQARHCGFTSVTSLLPPPSEPSECRAAVAPALRESTVTVTVARARVGAGPDSTLSTTSIPPTGTTRVRLVAASTLTPRDVCVVWPGLARLARAPRAASEIRATPVPPRSPHPPIGATPWRASAPSAPAGNTRFDHAWLRSSCACSVGKAHSSVDMSVG